MVAVRLARGWVGYGGSLHRAGELVDVDAITLAKLEACGVVTPWESLLCPGEAGADPESDEEF
jgi:hypothetical protein